MKKGFVKILSVLLALPMGLSLTGCYGLEDFVGVESMDNATFDEWFEKSNEYSVYGTKALYRPSDYDFDKNSRPWDAETGKVSETKNDYYAQYAWRILDSLHNVYNVITPKYFEGTKDSERDENKSAIPGIDYPASDIEYLYDASRYTITQTNEYIYDGSSEFVVVADTSKAWNWSLDVSTTETEAYLKNPINTFNKKSDFESLIKSQFNNPVFTNAYQLAYAGEESVKYDTYSDFAKALTYVIYRYSLDLEPEEMSVAKKDGEGNIKPTITINGKTVDDALTEVKDLHAKYAKIVGINEPFSQRIYNWTLNNVIGENAIRAQNTPITQITSTQKKDEDGNYLYLDADNNETTEITDKKVVEETQSSITINRDYANTLRKIFTKVSSLVSIGGFNDYPSVVEHLNESNIEVDKPYLSSYLTEYLGNSFMISGDKNFCRTENGKLPYSKLLIEPQEYQAVTMMFKEEFQIQSIWVALKYDVDCDGTGETEPVKKDETQYIEISLDLNYYNNATNTWQTVASSPRLKVYQGDYDIDYLEWSSENIFTNGGRRKCPEDHSSGYVFDALDVKVGAFNTEIGYKALMTQDIGYINYAPTSLVKQLPIRSKYPIRLSGHSEVRKYFDIVEPKTEDAFYTGRFNPSMFSGADGCDYLEVCYTIYKDKNQGLNKNYKFYTGFTAIIDE